jgi:hypothetical protein
VAESRSGDRNCPSWQCEHHLLAIHVGEKTELVLAAQKKDPVWAVPFLWKHEFLKILSFVVRKGILGIE